MKPDIKIGVLVGVVVVAVLLVFFAKKGSKPTENTTLVVPQEQDRGPYKPIQPVAQPVVKQQYPVVKPVIVDPQPTTIIVAEQPEPKIGPPSPEKTIASTPIAPVQPTPEARKPRYYLVKTGDSLSEISEDYYGHERFWREIYKANRQLIRNPDRLQVGWRLRIPYPEEISTLGENVQNP